jgi:dUTP pyrophosphatase
VKIKLLPNYDVLKWGFPARSTGMSAGYDLRFARPDAAIYPCEKVRVGVGFCLDMTTNPQMCAVIIPRSGLGTRGLVLANTIGLIDADYRGEIVVTLVNTSEDPIVLKSGDRIAQMVFLPVFTPEFELVGDFASTTERGAGGFGSTGVM